MITLWILVLGFKNVGGTVTLSTGQPLMQPIATYRTQKECDLASKVVFSGLQNGGVAANVICLPSGISDPVVNAPLPRHARADQSNPN